MFTKKDAEYYYDDQFGLIPIEFHEEEVIIRFLSSGGVKKGKLKRQAFYPFKYPNSGEHRVSVHRLNYSNVEFARNNAINIFKDNYRGLAYFEIKVPLTLNCEFETCPEDGVTQHAHIIYPLYEIPKPNEPLKAEITDIIEALYQYVKANNLFTVEKIDDLSENIVIPTTFPTHQDLEQ